MELETQVSTWFAGEDGDQVRAVFGALGPAGVASGMAAWIVDRAGARAVDCVYDHVSVGVTVELALDDGRRVVLKATARGTDAEAHHRGSALQVQAHLASLGFPAPALLAPPERLGGADLWLSAVADRGDAVRYDSDLAVVMAHAFARLVTLASAMSPRPALDRRGPPAGRLWPKPHSVIFDFEGTAASAGAIDAVAAEALAGLRAHQGPQVVAHGDWSRQNMAFRDGKVVAVFDWDSVRRGPEASVVAGAAAFHSHDWRLGEQDPDYDRYYLGVDETMGFVEAYRSARGVGWSTADEQALNDALLYSLAYQARCQHAHRPGVTDGAVARLFTFARALR